MARASRLTPSPTFILEAVRARLPEGRFVVALSGGADSAVVAWAVTEATGSELVRGVHIHHGQAASDDLARAALSIAKIVGIECSRIDVVVPDGASFEGRAREVRLEALAGAAAPDEWIITGHHADDSAETVLNNLLRGAGATGLSGIVPARGRWVRPMLEVDRRTIREAAADLKLPFLDDPANEDQSHRRNVIRSEVLPWLEERLAVPVGAVIRRSAESLALDDVTLEASAEAIPIGAGAGAVTVPVAVLSTISTAIAARVVRRALRRVHPPYAGNSSDIAAVLRVARGESSRENLAGGFLVTRENANVAIHRGEQARPEARLLAPGRIVEFGFWTVGASVVSPHDVRPALGRSRVRVRSQALAGDTWVRSAVEGERIDFSAGTKSVRDVMREALVPERLRSAWPVVAVDGKIAWVAGARVAQWARAAPAVDEFIELTMEGIVV